MSEAESRIQCGAEIYSSNNNNNNEGGSEEESRSKNRKKLYSLSPHISDLGAKPKQDLRTPYNSSPIRPLGSSDSTPDPGQLQLQSLPQLHSPILNSKGHTKGQSQAQVPKSPASTNTTTNSKKIRLPLPHSGKSSGKNRKDSSIPVGIAVARQRQVNVTSSGSSNTTMSSENPTSGIIKQQQHFKSKRASPHRPPQQIPESSAALIRIKSDRQSQSQRKEPKTINRSNTNSGSKKSVLPVCHQKSRSRDSGMVAAGVNAENNVTTPAAGLANTESTTAAQQQQHLIYAERRRLAENGVGLIGNNRHEFPGYSSGYANSPHFGEWASQQLNVPQLPPSYSTAAATAYIQQQHQQLSMHPEMPLQLSQSYGYNLSPYLYSGYPAESILQYEQFFRQQQQSREEQLRQQQQHLHPQDFDINRSACRSVTPIPSLSPRISIPSPSPNSHANLNLYSNHPHWSTEVYQHHHYFTSSTATLSPRSLTSSTPSPVTVHDSHPYLLARKCVTPNPIGVGSGSKHFPFSSHFSPSLLPARDVWKDVKISPIANPTSSEICRDKSANAELSPSEKESEVERPTICETPGSTRHDFRRMESLIEKRVEESVPILLQSPVELEVEENSSINSNSLSLSLELEDEFKERKANPIVGTPKVCDGKKLSVPESTRNLGSTLRSTSRAATATPREGQEQDNKKTTRLKPARPMSRRPSSCSKNDTQRKGNSEKYFIPVKREFYEFNNSKVEACNYSTKQSPISLSSRVLESATSVATISSDTTQKSIRVIDISRVKIEKVESIYVEGRGRTSAAGDDPPDWRSRRPETKGCSDVVSTLNLSESSQDLKHFQHLISTSNTVKENLVTKETAVTMETTADMIPVDCDHEIMINRIGSISNFVDQQDQHSHNITVTVNLPQESDGMINSTNISPAKSSSSAASYTSDLPSFPKIVISSAESHLNLLATVAQEIGPYISMNTSRSPRRYESLIQIEPAEVSERRPSLAGSCASTSTSTISRISIDENTNFSPAQLSQAISISDHESTHGNIFEAATMMILDTGSSLEAQTNKSSSHLPYQLKIPQVIPRLQSTKTKLMKKEKRKSEIPKKNSIVKIKTVKGESRIGKDKRVRPNGGSAVGIASTKPVKKPKERKLSSETTKKISTGKATVIFRKTSVPHQENNGDSSQSKYQMPLNRNPCIYDFDDTKPNLEPLYNRLEKPGHIQHRRHLGQSAKTSMAKTKSKGMEIAGAEATAALISNQDLKHKSVSRINKDKVKSKDQNKFAKKSEKILNSPSTRTMTMTADDKKKEKGISKKTKPKEREISKKTKPKEKDSKILPSSKSSKATPSLTPLSASSGPIPTMQMQSLLTSMTCQGQDSSSSESSMWVTDPAHAVTAIKNETSEPVVPARKLSAEGKAVRKRRKLMRPSKLTLLKDPDNSRSVEEPVTATPGDTPVTLKSQNKSFVHFSAPKKNGHHHIKPCLKAEPEFKEEIPSSESESEMEDLDVDLKNVSVEPVTTLVALKPLKIRKPSIDMNIFSRRVRLSDDGGKENGKGTDGDGSNRKSEENPESEWNENVILGGVQEMLDEMRILTEIQGLFYTGKLNALQPPDVYGVTLDNERGAPPHLIYSAEEVLEKCIREAKPWKASQLPHGLRICAYWSPQYSGLYPGKVSTDYDSVTDLVPVEFDDGDTGVIKIGEIRLLACNHPIREYDPNPLLTLEKKHRKRHHSSATGSQSSECNGLHEDADCGEPYCAKVAKMKESDYEDMSDSADSSKLMYWTWTGLGHKRPGTKKNRNKEFHHGIQRGDEVINVGDSALFISNGNVRPFLGRIERFWEKKGKKIVNVRWFYHPEEVKTRKRLSGIKYPGALFESPHIDENDVQTIARKCEVLPFETFQEKYGHRFTSKAGRNLSGYKKGASPKDTYYLAGYYDPYTYNLQLNDLK